MTIEQDHIAAMEDHQAAEGWSVTDLRGHRVPEDEVCSNCGEPCCADCVTTCSVCGEDCGPCCSSVCRHKSGLSDRSMCGRVVCHRPECEDHFGRSPNGTTDGCWCLPCTAAELCRILGGDAENERQYGLMLGCILIDRARASVSPSLTTDDYKRILKAVGR